MVISQSKKSCHSKFDEKSRSRSNGYQQVYTKNTEFSRGYLHVEDTKQDNNAPEFQQGPRLLYTHEGATTFPVDDPFVRLVFNYGSFLPESDTYYGSPEDQLLGFIDALKWAAGAHPELALQYAAWQRDPRMGKGNRSQPPWAIAVLSSVPACLAHPRFAELVAKCIIRPDDALNITLAATKLLGDNQLPPQLKQGVASGLDHMSDYQLTKYASASKNLLPEKRKRPSQKALPAGRDGSDRANPDKDSAVEKVAVPAPGQRTLRLVDVLGICKNELSPRLFALYRYLHAPTRLQSQLLPELEAHLPLFGQQKMLRANAPRAVDQVEGWVEQALQARMTMEQMLSAVGQRQSVKELPEPPASKTGAPDKPENATEQQIQAGESLGRRLLDRLKKQWSGGSTSEDVGDQTKAVQKTQPLTEEDITYWHVRKALWQALMSARVSDEERPERQVPLLGDVAFMRNIRAIYQAGISVKHLQDEARTRAFSGIWPFQILGSARQVAQGRKRKTYQSQPCPEVMPVFDCIFDKTVLSLLPKKSDGTCYRILGLADVSGSMCVKLGGKQSSTTCMDAALSFSTAFSFTMRTERSGGLAGTWDDGVHLVQPKVQDGANAIFKKVQASGGWGGTQIFGSIMALTDWLLTHPKVPRPEVLVILSDMQFHPAAELDTWSLRRLPPRYQEALKRREFKSVPPLAAALVLYRELLASDISVVIWNLAAYEGSPVPSGMDRVLLLSGFDANSLRTIEQWLRAGSPGSAMPTAVGVAARPDSQAGTVPLAGSGESGSSFEAVLAALRRY
jgi:hypothetical protein